MKVLLIETVDNLGGAGEVKKVAEGYARNFLIPKGLAVPATEGALKQAELRRQAEAKRQKREEMKAESLAKTLSQVTLTLRAKAGEKDKLYGSITNANIAQALERETGQAGVLVVRQAEVEFKHVRSGGRGLELRCRAGGDGQRPADCLAASKAAEVEAVRGDGHRIGDAQRHRQGHPVAWPDPKGWPWTDDTAVLAPV